MLKYILRRLVTAPLVIFLLLVITFTMVRVAPGSPFSSEKATPPEIQERQRAFYHLDKSIPVQFIYYLGNVVRGDLGPSLKYKDLTVNEIISRHWLPSFVLGTTAMALALVMGMTAGILAGLKPNSRWDYSSMTISMVGITLPAFVTGPLLVVVFSLKLGWFRVSGWDANGFSKDIVLPAITLSLPYAARIARLMRAGLLEVVNQDYIRTARAKGLREHVVVLRHALKGALLPVVSFLGPAVAFIITGSLVVETIFQVPGLGRQFTQSALNRDYGLTQGLVVFVGTLLVVLNLVVDVAYGFLDPRIRYD
ncbi:ABC transporter permease subunit [bacterium]|nr:ABC transporter permease subunit [bacterium]